jgi:Chaperone for flagella basal body P-ring formation
MGRTSLTVLVGVLAATSLAGSAQSPPANITPQQIVATLLRNNISVSDEDVSLPSRIPTRINNPLLEIIYASTAYNGIAVVKLRCLDVRNCLPFYAVITAIHGGALEARLPPRPASASHLPTPPRPPEPWLVRSGQRATLVLEGRHLRLQMPVICLANGSAGKSIRVTTINGKQIYRAEVAGAGLLKGGL